jgi:hypothetical protein
MNNIVKLNTLDSIIDDIILEAKSNNVSESDKLNRNQIEQWIIQYRALLIKQDIDKGRDINPQYIQIIDNISLDIVDYVDSDELSGSKKILVTSVEIPSTIDFHYKSGITYVSDLFGNEIQLMSEKRSNIQKYRKYTFYAYSAFLKSNKLYINGPGDIQAISVHGIFQDPASVDGFSASSSEYPIPVNMIPVIKDLIFTKDLSRGMMVDNINNTSDDTVYNKTEISTKK